jgi:predicted nuclease of restriction endonuclease-like RecB superfamily
VEQALYADLRAAQRLVKGPRQSAAAIVAGYDLAQAQAVLLRAVKVSATVRCSSVEAYRALFRALKFHRLLYRLSALPEGAYRIELDGPFSMFENVTKYGLQLALVLPALQRADELQLEAEVRWGKARQPLLFRWQHRRSGAEISAEARLPDELVELITAFRAQGSGWQVAGAQKLIDLPGVGLCVPDLIFSSPSGHEVYFELLGYWSREAVWKRVELAKQVKKLRLLFAVSSRLRVSETVLGEEEHAALYVFKGVMNPRALLKKLEALVAA